MIDYKNITKKLVKKFKLSYRNGRLFCFVEEHPRCLKSKEEFISFIASKKCIREEFKELNSFKIKDWNILYYETLNRSYKHIFETDIKFSKTLDYCTDKGPLYLCELETPWSSNDHFLYGKIPAVLLAEKDPDFESTDLSIFPIFNISLVNVPSIHDRYHPGNLELPIIIGNHLLEMFSVYLELFQLLAISASCIPCADYKKIYWVHDLNPVANIFPEWFQYFLGSEKCAVLSLDELEDEKISPKLELTLATLVNINPVNIDDNINLSSIRRYVSNYIFSDIKGKPNDAFLNCSTLVFYSNVENYHPKLLEFYYYMRDLVIPIRIKSKNSPNMLHKIMSSEKRDQIFAASLSLAPQYTYALNYIKLGTRYIIEKTYNEKFFFIHNKDYESILKKKYNLFLNNKSSADLNDTENIEIENDFISYSEKRIIDTFIKIYALKGQEYKIPCKELYAYYEKYFYSALWKLDLPELVSPPKKVSILKHFKAYVNNTYEVSKDRASVNHFVGIKINEAKIEKRLKKT